MGVYGKGEDCKFMLEETSGTDAVVSHPINAMQDYDIAGMQFIVDPKEATITVEEGDAVDASDTEFSFAGFDFTGLEGGVLTIAGATDPGNNGDFTVTTGGDGTAVCADAVGLADETFDPEEVTVTFTYPLMEGAWLVEVSNDVTPDGMAGSYDQDSGVEGHWSTLPNATAFFPPIVDVDATEAASYSQYVQATICVRALRFTFTPTSGYGIPTVLGQARSYS